MTTTFAIALNNGEAQLPDQFIVVDQRLCNICGQPQERVHRKCKEAVMEYCAYCSNPATHEYDGIKLCFPHFVSEERANE